MSLRLLLLCTICLGCAAVTRADNDVKAKSSKLTAKHISAKSSKSALNHITNAPDSGRAFKDLFIPISSPLESNGSRLNPRAISFVQDYVDKNGKHLQEMKGWGRPYFNLIDGVLSKYGLPKELKYLAVIESELKPKSTSWAGAVGPWQLMPGTARILGLTVSHKHDDRTNYYKSTQAAALYLRDLYKELGDWLLVIAAYNGGTGNVYKAINRSHSRDFWDLQYYLPAESRNHVKKFIGTHYIFEGQGGVTTLTRDEASEQLSGSSMYVHQRNISSQEMNTTKTIPVSGKYFSQVIAKYTVMTVDDFNRFNPYFDKVMASTNNTYDLKLPAEKAELFAANKYQILNESVQILLSGGNPGDSSANTASLVADPAKVPSLPLSGKGDQ